MNSSNIVSQEEINNLFAWCEYPQKPKQCKEKKLAAFIHAHLESPQ